MHVDDSLTGKSSTMHVVDLSQKLDENSSVYPGDPVLSCHRVSTIEDDHFNVSSITLGSHTGTHIDAPYHRFNHGKKIDELDLSELVGPVAVVDLSGKKAARQKITWDDLSPFTSIIKKHRLVFIRTGWSTHWGKPEYFNHPFLDRTAAEGLIANGVRVVGVDTLSPDETVIEPNDAVGDFAVHDVVLASGCVIVENLTNLDRLPPEGAIASVVPLNLVGIDGSPIRAVAWLAP